MPKLTPEQRVVDAAESIAAQSYATREALRRLTANEEARRILRSERRPKIPAVKSLAAFLAEPDEQTRYRVNELLPTGGTVLIAAQYKAGKTTLVNNLIRSLADGTPFLGRFETTPVTGNVVVLDFEMPEGEARRWLRDTRITRSGAVFYMSMRGKAASFDPTDADCRAEWAELLRTIKCEVLVVDCLAPIAAALGLDDNLNADMGPLCEGLSALVTEAGAAEVFLIHHMGHKAERARGASVLLGWPDALWKISRPGEDPAGPRYFSAFGRSVDVPERSLLFDGQTRALSLADGGRSRGPAAVSGIEGYVSQLVAAGVPGELGRERLKAFADSHEIALPSNNGLLGQITKAVKAWRDSERLPGV